MTTRLTTLLNVHSCFSFGAGVSLPATLLRRAAQLGYDHLCLTDRNGVYGAAELARTARELGMRFSVGATVTLEYEGELYPLVLIAEGRRGYRGLNTLLTRVHEQESRALPLSVLLAHGEGLHCLTGGRRGFPTELLARRRPRRAEALCEELGAAFPDRLWLQLYFDHYPGDARRARSLRAFAQRRRLPVVAAPEVRYARPELYPLYDALVCARLGITVETPHRARPQNDCQAIPDPETLPLAFPEALANAAALAAATAFELLPERLEPPPAHVPPGLAPDAYLEQRCFQALLGRYGGERLAEARARLEEELVTIRALGLAEFFLAAAEVTDYCRSRGITASGRGSAAASVVCYLLGVTRVEPLKNRLLFERFLALGRKVMPDIDIDIASSRRDEVLAWVERRFGETTEAMVCNRIAYRLPLAVQDLGRALGLPPPLRDRLGKALGRDYRRLRPGRARLAAAAFDEVLGDAPVKELLLGLLEKMEDGLVRHIAPHAGGVVLSREPLAHYSPLERSSGGIRTLQFDKDDVEALGLIKLDLLGLRMLSALQRAREEVLRTEGVWLDLFDLPDEEAIWERIGRGETLGLFQIESPSQMRISVQLRPRSLRELAHQIALIRPGPIQSGTVHPYVRRRRGQEPVRYLHPALRPILEETYGVILFQEQILRIARHVAGMSWQGADRFRKKVSGFERLEDIEPERQAFVEGVIRTVDASREQAEAIFEAVKAFQGFGFAESHAWAFAVHAYASTWLRHYYPAEYLAALLTEAPGMWPAGTLRQEARSWGVPILRLDVNRSGLAYRCERDEDAEDEQAAVKGVRPPLQAVRGVSREAAEALLLARFEGGAFAGLRDLYARVPLERPQFEALVRAGACDRFGPRRELLFELQALANSVPAGRPTLLATVPGAPRLARLELRERILWDHELKGFAEMAVHPLDLIRGELRDLGAEPFARLRRHAGRIRTAGLVVARQKPPTARGFAFFVLEDGPDRVQLVIPPDLWARERTTLRDAPVLLAEGELSHAGSTMSLRAERLWGIPLRWRVRGHHYG